jgi:replicative DNA helicase
MRKIEQSILKKCIYSIEHRTRLLKGRNIFSFPEHQELFEILKDLQKKDDFIDHVLIGEEIKKKKMQTFTLLVYNRNGNRCKRYRI